MELPAKVLLFPNGKHETYLELKKGSGAWVAVSEKELTALAKRKKPIQISKDAELDLDEEAAQLTARGKLKSFLKGVVAKKQAAMSEAKQKEYFESKEVRDRIRAKLIKADLSPEKGKPNPLHTTEDFLKRLKSTGEPAFYVLYNNLAYPRVSNYDQIERYLTVNMGGPGAKPTKSVSSNMKVSVFHITTSHDTKEEIEARIKAAELRAAQKTFQPKKYLPIPADLKEQTFVDKETMESYGFHAAETRLPDDSKFAVYFNDTDFYLQDEDGNAVKYIGHEKDYAKLRERVIKESLEVVKKRRTEVKVEPKPERKSEPTSDSKKIEAKKQDTKLSEAKKQLGRFLEKYEHQYKFIKRKYKEDTLRGFVSLDIKKTSSADWKLIKPLGDFSDSIQLTTGVIDDEITVDSEGKLFVIMSNIVEDEGRMRERLSELGRLLTK